MNTKRFSTITIHFTMSTNQVSLYTKYLLSTCYMPSTVLGVKYTSMGNISHRNLAHFRVDYSERPQNSSVYISEQWLQTQASLPHIPLGAQEKGPQTAVTLQRQSSCATETQALTYSIIKGSPSLTFIRHTLKVVGSPSPRHLPAVSFSHKLAISRFQNNSFQISRHRSKQSINIVKQVKNLLDFCSPTQDRTHLISPIHP